MLGACYVHVLNNDITSGRTFNFDKTAIRNCYEVGLITISTRDVNTTSFSSGDSTSCEVINNVNNNGTRRYGDRQVNLIAIKVDGQFVIDALGLDHTFSIAYLVGTEVGVHFASNVATVGRAESSGFISHISSP